MVHQWDGRKETIAVPSEYSALASCEGGVSGQYRLRQINIETVFAKLLTGFYRAILNSPGLGPDI